MPKIKYTPINLPTDLVEELKVWRMAFTASYCKPITYAQMIRGMLDSLEASEPGVCDELDRLVERHPELMERLSKYTGDGDAQS